MSNTLSDMMDRLQKYNVLNLLWDLNISDKNPGDLMKTRNEMKGNPTISTSKKYIAGEIRKTIKKYTTVHNKTI